MTWRQIIKGKECNIYTKTQGAVNTCITIDRPTSMVKVSQQRYHNSNTHEILLTFNDVECILAKMKELFKE